MCVLIAYNYFYFSKLYPTPCLVLSSKWNGVSHSFHSSQFKGLLAFSVYPVILENALIEVKAC